MAHPTPRADALAKKPGVLEKRRHQIFMRRSYQAYKDLERRYNEQIFSGPSKKRKKLPLPFTLEQLRDRIKVALNEGIWCPYLGQLEKLTVRNFSVDHVVPIARGGSVFSFDNLIVCSRSANLAKGEMTGKEFQELIGMMTDAADNGANAWPREALMDVIGRLKAGAAVKRLRFLGRH
jgi:5-methylcytosine-specific restriction endonuclease McrA